MSPIKNQSRNTRRDISLPRPRQSRVGCVRIIAGLWRKTPLVVSNLDGLRPTGDRIRETLFNWITHFKGDYSSLTGLDFFAGSGAVGFEFASRGAKEVVLVEKNRIAIKALKATKEKLHAEQIRIIEGDAFAKVEQLQDQFDVIFVDPPFAMNFHEKALNVALNHLKPEGLLYVESPKEWDAEKVINELNLDVMREATAGAVTYRLLKRKD